MGGRRCRGFGGCEEPMENNMPCTLPEEEMIKHEYKLRHRTGEITNEVDWYCPDCWDLFQGHLEFWRDLSD